MNLDTLPVPPAPDTVGWAHAKRQVGRLKVLAYFPVDNDAREDIAKVLAKECIGRRLGADRKRYTADQQFEAVISDALGSLDGWRGPVQLREIHSHLFPAYYAVE